MLDVVDVGVQTDVPTFPEILVSPILADIAKDAAPQSPPTNIPTKCIVGLPTGIDWDEETQRNNQQVFCYLWPTVKKLKEKEKRRTE